MTITPAVKGFLYSAFAYLLFTGFDTATKIAAKSYSVIEIMAVEFTAATLFLLAWAWLEQGKNFRKVVTFKKKHLHAARGFLNASSNILFFLGFTNMQLTEYYVILFLIPIWVAILAAVFLKEKAGLSLIISILLSFAGVVIALRPEGGFSLATLLVFGGTITNAFGLIFLRQMTKTETQMSTPISVSFFMAITNLALLPFFFKMPDLFNFGMMVLGGIFFGVAQRFLTLGTQLAPAGIAASSAFLQLIYGAIVGYIVFADVPSVWIYVGGGVVIAANLFLMWSQNRKKPF